MLTAVASSSLGIVAFDQLDFAILTAKLFQLRDRGMRL
jgi:hypothetical protein